MEFKPIEQVSKIIMGQSPKKEDVNKAKNGLPLLNGPTEFGDFHPIPVQYTTSTKRIAPKGSLLFCVRGSTTGRMNWADQDYAIGRGLAAIICDNPVHKFYIRYVIEKNLDLLLKSATGSTFPNVSSNLLKSFPVPVIANIEYVANFLETIDSKIYNNNSIINNLESLARLIFRSWFIDFEFPNEQGQPYKSNNGEMVKSELGEIPKGWKVITIRDICDVNKGSLSKKDDWAYINYLDTSNITKNSIQNIQFIDTIKDKVPSRAKRKVQLNDIIYSTVRPNQHHYGIIKKPVENMVVSTGFTVLRSKGMYSNDLVYLWLTQEEAIDNLQAIAEQSTSAYPSIKSDDILSMKILLPPQEILDALNEVIETQNKAIWNYHQENKKLSELRNTLLPKLLSGEIEMPNELVVN